MAEYIVTRDTSYSGSSQENIQQRSVADKIWLYAARANFALLYMIGGWLPNPKTGMWEKYKGKIKTRIKHAKTIEWYDEDLASMKATSGAAIADKTTTGLVWAATADYNKLRANDIIRCKQTGEVAFVVSRDGSLTTTVRRGLSVAGSSTAVNIPASAEWQIVSRGFKEYSGVGTERDTLATNHSNNMQIVRDDASIARSEEELLMEVNGEQDPKGRRKAKSLYMYMMLKNGALYYGGKGSTTDTDSKTVNLMGGLNDKITANILAAQSSDSSSEFSGAGHGGTLSFDEFMEYTRILGKQWTLGDECFLNGGSIWKTLFTKWAKDYPHLQFTFNDDKDQFGFNVNKIKTPFLRINHVPDGTVEENEEGAGYFLDPTGLQVVYHQPDKYTELDMMKTQRIDGTAWTWLCEMTLQVLGYKRMGKITGVTGAET